MADKTDLHKGIYRRIYAGFIGGRRINKVSLESEAWFWRLHAIADDFGNFPADAIILYRKTSGLRQIGQRKVMKLFAELVEVGLIDTYSVEDEQFGHIIDFANTQPGGKNGKRVRKWPVNPDNSKTIQDNPILPGVKIPNKSKPSHSHNHSHKHHHPQGNNFLAILKRAGISDKKRQVIMAVEEITPQIFLAHAYAAKESGAKKPAHAAAHRIIDEQKPPTFKYGMLVYAKKQPWLESIGGYPVALVELRGTNGVWVNGECICAMKDVAALDLA